MGLRQLPEKFNISFSASLFSYSAELFCSELCSRVPCCAGINENDPEALFYFEYKDTGRDDYEIKEQNGRYILCASGIRGSIYAIGRVLRKIRIRDGRIFLDEKVPGSFTPDKPVRGHQTGYRTTTNTYEAWSYDDFERYFLDMMYFGANTAEHIPYQDGFSKRNPLMKYDEEEFLKGIAPVHDKLDLDLSIWHPNYRETDEEAALRRGKLYSEICRIDHLFIPGGDPGEMRAEDFIRRSIGIARELKKHHPGAVMWLSAQAPHSIADWGEKFIEGVNEYPEGIDGVIYGPNHPVSLEYLRDNIPSRYPIRFYPDITHNVRCEYPVHYDRDDWHFAFTTALGRECVNPRPLEYARLHRETSSYVIGSVSYSEGINDDVNKAVFSALDYDPNVTVDEILGDYCRLYFPGADDEKLANLILGLEQNWEGSPDENLGIDKVYSGFIDAGEKYSFLNDNWRFLCLYLRAVCDEYIRCRFIFENNLIKESLAELKNGNYLCARAVLETAYPAEITGMRAVIGDVCRKLFDLIGLQTDVEHYYADNPERGAILDTIDLPLTDRAYLLDKFGKYDTCEEMLDFYNHIAPVCDAYYCVSRCGMPAYRSYDPYKNFLGDRPHINTGDLPVALFAIYDNTEFDMTFEGLDAGTDYLMRVVYLDKKCSDNEEFRVTVNGETLYSGYRFGNTDPKYDSKYLKDGFVSAVYRIPARLIKDGRARVNISEKNIGVYIAEIIILSDKKD